MTLLERAKAAMIARALQGEPFMSRDLASIAVELGVGKSRAAVLANSTTQWLKSHRKIGRAGGHRGSAYVWQTIPDPPPPPSPPPVLAMPVDAGPYDPAPEIEGPNNGLTTAFAEHLWHDLGAGSPENALRSLSAMEQRAWREAAERALKFLFDRGMVGPCGLPRQKFTGWSYKWLYEANSWEIVDEEGGFVALIANDTDAPLFLAAPDMAAIIEHVLESVAERGGVKRADLDELARSLPVTSPWRRNPEQTA